VLAEQCLLTPDNARLMPVRHGTQTTSPITMMSTLQYRATPHRTRLRVTVTASCDEHVTLLAWTGQLDRQSTLVASQQLVLLTTARHVDVIFIITQTHAHLTTHDTLLDRSFIITYNVHFLLLPTNLLTELNK